MEKLCLTKSRFLAGMQCPLKLWLQCHRPDLGQPPSSFDQFRMDAGIAVGKLACTQYPDGRFVEIALGGVEQAISGTQQLVEDESVPAIFEATFNHNDLLIRTDILKRAEWGQWDLLEIKSGTSLKEENIYDVWFQHHVLIELGVVLNDVGVLHVSKEYIFDGQNIDLEQFFTFHDLKTEVSGLNDELSDGLDTLVNIVDQEEPPAIEMTKRRCGGCEFFSHCGREKPEYWIYYLPRISEKKWNELTELGVDNILAVPEDFKLTPSQALVRESSIAGEEHIGSGLAEALHDLEFPLYFLDFETFSEPIPRYNGLKPWQQVTFQWSCHILTEDGTLSHSEFLFDSEADPRPGFIESMLDCIPEGGTIIHYAPFEKSRIKELAAAFPESAEPLKALSDRLVDLCQILKSHYYHPGFMGSYSIKQVLPVMVPELSYDALDIQEGGTASVEYLRMTDPGTSADEKANIRKALLEYCKLDTLAMVRIWQSLGSKTSCA